MRRSLCAFLLLCAAGLAGAPAQAGGPAAFTPTVILISLDGFRWDYPAKAPTPNLRALMRRGVRADNLIPVFPSKTLPNHYSIVTGLYPSEHGIVANNITDPITGRTLTMAKRREVQDPMWWGGEPIWVAVERAGHAASPFFWPGSEAPIGGIRPRFWQPYDEDLPANQRVDQVLRWLDLPAAQRPTFLTLYFEDTDTAGHDDGPDSLSVREAITRVDGHLGRLVHGLERRGILDRINIVVVADHGMAATSPDQVVYVDDYISLSDVDISEINPTLGIFPKPGKADAVYRALVNAHPRLKVYRKDETPVAWHYRNHPRIPPIIGVADEGWEVMRRASLGRTAALVRGAGGTHGYDPMLMSMRAIFVAAGPAFKQGVTVPAFENIHIYQVLANVLGVEPARNSGDPSVARALLREGP